VIRRRAPLTLARVSCPRAPVIRALWLVAVLSACFGLERVAHADVEPIRIEYKAHAECPSAGQFQRQVFARTSAARLAANGETARGFSIELERRGAKFIGSLTVYEPDGVSMARTFSGAQCNEVALVLALATALAIDPRAELTPHDIPGEATPAESAGSTTRNSEPQSTSPPSSPVPKTEPTAKGGDDDDDGDDDRAVVVPYEPPVAEPTDPREPASFGIALGPRLAVGSAPKVALGGGLQLQGYGRGAIASAGVELAWLGTAPLQLDGASADFRFWLVRPQLCTSRAQLGGGFNLGPCLAVELGTVVGAGYGLPFASSARRFWSTVELALRLDREIAGPWFANLDAGVAMPLTRYRFVFEGPETSIHSVAQITPIVALGIGARF
jgi:hypothetical protein